MIVNARNFSLTDLLTEFEDARDFRNRNHCPICNWLKANIERNKVVAPADQTTVDDFEEWIFRGDEDVAVQYIVDVIWAAGLHHPPDITWHVQEAYAWQLTQYSWEVIRQPLEMLLHGDIPQGLGRGAVQLLMGIVRANHPNAKAFLMQPYIVTKIPEDIDFSHFPCVNAPNHRLLPAKGKGPRSLDKTKARWTDLTSDEAKAAAKEQPNDE